MATKKEQEAAAKKRSAAAKKAAATRARKTQETAQPDAQSDQPQVDAASEELPRYQPRHQSLQAAGLDQHAAEKERQAELDAARQAHNERTGDASRA